MEILLRLKMLDKSLYKDDRLYIPASQAEAVVTVVAQAAEVLVVEAMLDQTKRGDYYVRQKRSY